MKEQGDLLLGFVLTMDEVSRHASDLEAAATALGAPPMEGLAVWPPGRLAAAGYAVYPFQAPLPGDPRGRGVYVGWSLLPAPVGPGAGAAPVDRERLREAEGRVTQLLRLLKLDKPVSYHLVVSSALAGSGPDERV